MSSIFQKERRPHQQSRCVRKGPRNLGPIGFFVLDSEHVVSASPDAMIVVSEVQPNKVAGPFVMPGFDPFR